MSIKCQFCEKECSSNLSKTAHQRFCKLNPDYQENIKKHAQFISKAGAIKAGEISHKKALQDPLNQIQTYTLICMKCGKEYTLDLRIRDFNNGNYRKTCSNKCANARVLTEEAKKRKSENLKKEHLHTCPKCGKQFIHKGTAGNTECNECFLKRTSRIQIDSYEKRKYTSASERIHVCRLCKKEYILNKKDNPLKATNTFCCHQHFIQWRSNRRKYDPEYCQKLSQSTKRLMAQGKIKPWQSRNIKSYAQKFFHKVLQLNHIPYISQKYQSGYFLDFVIQTQRGLIDLQIDGKQHWNQVQRIQHDRIRDERLKQLGYDVYRIPWNSLNTQSGKLLMKQKVQAFLNYVKV